MGLLLNPYISFGAGGNTFYVDPAGDNGDAGTEAEPWATLTFAATQLAANDTLVVGGGTYFESDIAVDSDSVSIVAATGETPIIDGSLAGYRAAPNSLWELVDGGINLYRTVATVADPGDFMWMGRIDVGGTLYMLTSYRDFDVQVGIDFLSAAEDLYTNLAPFYMGPGIAYSAGRIYIRLEPNSDEAQWVGDPVGEAPFVISDLNPNNHAIHLCPNSYGIVVSGDGVEISGLTVRHHWTGIAGAGSNVTVQDCTIRPTRFGMRMDGADWNVDGVDINFDRPSWLARSDVKSSGEPAQDNRTGGISFEGSSGHTVTDSTIVGAFDGFLLLGGDSHDITITGCTIDDSMDDGCQTGSGTYNIEFGYNLWTGAGPSHDGSGGDTADTPASVYLHHNVFDNSATIFWARKPQPGEDPAENGDGGYLHPPIHSSHAVPDFDDPWKIYNNTYQAYTSPGIQGINHYMYHGAAPGNGVHEAYNNIFNILSTEARMYRNANAATGKEIYDYNLYRRTESTGQFAIECVDTNGDPVAVSTAFADWLTDMGGTTAYYPDGWDSHSTSGTTMVPLDGSYRPAIGGPADGTGVDLSAKGWPGTTPGTDYIGAKAPV